MGGLTASHFILYRAESHSIEPSTTVEATTP
jgi:hypothetical protein